MATGIRAETRQVDHDRLLRAASDHDDGLVVGVRVLLAVRSEGRDPHEIAGLSFDTHFTAVAPEDEYRVAGNHMDTGLGTAVMVVRRPGAGGDVGAAHPDVLCADAFARDGLQALHARRLSGVGHELVRANSDERRVPPVRGPARIPYRPPHSQQKS